MSARYSFALACFFLLPAGVIAEGPVDQEATDLARKVHRNAAAINDLPKFFYRVKERHGVVKGMESAPHETYPLLLKALEGDIAGERAFKASYTFAYDEQRFLMEEDYESADIVSSKFWDRNQAWSKNHVAGYPPTFVKDKSPEKFWSNVPLFMFTCYLRQTPREYWWESKCMSIRASASFRQRWRPT